MKYKLIRIDNKLYTSIKTKNKNVDKTYIPSAYLEAINKQKRFINNSVNVLNKIHIPNFNVSSSVTMNLETFKIPKMNFVTLNDLITETVAKVNKILNDSIKVKINLINNITASVDLDKIRETVRQITESLRQFIEYCEQYKMSMSLEYFSDYYDIYLEKNKITDEDIYVTFKKHFVTIKENLIENDFYHIKNSYIKRILNNFENKRYTEVAMLSLSVIDYLTIYRACNEKREPKYKSINNVLNKQVRDNESGIEEIITQYTVQLIKSYYSSDNDLEDPKYINRNRLMHGIMDIETIKKLDCIKLIYLLDVLSSMNVHFVE
ncbi:hypothetical protein [Staphylococcus sp. GDY8P85P]|uniref:hypothetical protein n=1 Tax=Staphylococcus sp. GDY8P85P TaxID=2804138 RepID=UPI001AEC4534|nr:hypothetical protein [Staphylococcus sp. GDY8P85P]HCW0122392.1 hypothetical protein [Staphylococcus aureus]HDX8652191.1 hypothetical protein [Staphylococcus aureus]